MDLEVPKFAGSLTVTKAYRQKSFKATYSEVSSGLLLGEEDSGGLNDVLGSGGGPRDVVGVPLAVDGNLASVDHLGYRKLGIRTTIVSEQYIMLVLGFKTLT